MLNKFKIGDIIRGTKGAGQYGYTTEYATMEVIAHQVGRDDIEVRILTQEREPGEVGNEYSVNSQYFDLIKRHVKPTILIVRKHAK